MDGGIRKTLQEIKKMVVDGDPNDSSQCNDVLSKFFTACDPNSESCSNANQHTFQGKTYFIFLLIWPYFFQYLIDFHLQMNTATIDQVCEAVNTKVKLNFEGANAF